MDAKIAVSAIVATLNEEKNLARCLSSLENFDEVIVFDSNSTDKTPEIARSFGATYVPFTWNGQYPKKRQWALDNLALKHERVFFIDADEEATAALCDEIASLDWKAPGYFVRGYYVVNGKTLRYGIYNKKLCLFDRRMISFPVVDDLTISGMGEIEGHYQPVVTSGGSIKFPLLKQAVLHHALEDRDKYISRHAEYTKWRQGMDTRKVHPKDPVLWRETAKKLYRRMPLKGMIFFVYYYFVRLGILEYKNNLAIYYEKRKYHITQ